MATKTTNNVLTDADRIVDTWTENTDFKLGDVTLAKFTAAHDALVAADTALEKNRSEQTALLNARGASAAALQTLVSRARSGFRAVYGPDSTQYEQAGGTRTSERKKGTVRKKRPPKP